MTIGEKIKKARKEQGKTQSELAGDRITRNMLSAIESNKAYPSVETAKYIANELNLPFEYLISDEDNVFWYKKKEIILKIKAEYKNKSFFSCINLIESLGELDDELAYILCDCHFSIGKDYIVNGSLSTGEKHIENALKYAKLTIYTTSHIEANALIYKSISSNIQAPLLELNTEEFSRLCENLTDVELYNYVIQNDNYEFSNPIFLKHQNARILIKERKFVDSLKLLHEIENERTRNNYHAYVVFSIYTDIERCYREIRDYENAYRYANKRLSLLEAFKQ